MPVLKNYLVFKPTKNIIAFLTLNAGVMRSDTTDPERALAQAERGERPRSRVNQPEPNTNDSTQAGKFEAAQEKESKELRKALKNARARIEDQKVHIDRWRNAAQEKDFRIALLEEKLATNGLGDPESSVVHPEAVVWVFGMILTGSSWLASMMEELEGHPMWDEPRIGELFGHFFHGKAIHHRDSKGSILGSEQKGTWLRSIRTFVLDALEAKYPLLAEGGYLVIKESSGSIGAPLLAEALPESRMIFLIRHPRDVVSSVLEVGREGEGAFELKGNDIGCEVMLDSIDEQSTSRTEQHADALVEKLARMYLQYAGNAKEAYERHRGPKALVRYEDLLTDTLGTMRRVYSELGMAIDNGKLIEVTEQHSKEQPPGKNEGKGNLTKEQVGIVEKVTAPLLEEFYSG